MPGFHALTIRSNTFNDWKQRFQWAEATFPMSGSNPPRNSFEKRLHFQQIYPKKIWKLEYFFVSLQKFKVNNGKKQKTTPHTEKHNHH